MPAAGGEVIAEGPQVARPAAYARDVARLATAAQALGVGLALLDRTVAYVKQRTQFGAAIGSFQAVKHRLADTLIGARIRPAAAVRGGPVHGSGRHRRREGHGRRGRVRRRPYRTPAARRDRLHRRVRPVPVAAQGPPLRDAWGTPASAGPTVLAG